MKARAAPGLLALIVAAHLCSCWAAAAGAAADTDGDLAELGLWDLLEPMPRTRSTLELEAVLTGASPGVYGGSPSPGIYGVDVSPAPTASPPPLNGSMSPPPSVNATSSPPPSTNATSSPAPSFNVTSSPAPSVNATSSPPPSVDTTSSPAPSPSIPEASPSPGLSAAPTPSPPLAPPSTSAVCEGRESDPLCTARVPLMNVTMMTVGNLANCEGTYTSLVNDALAPLPLLTSLQGSTSLPDAMLGTFLFPGGAGCVDTVTNQSVGYAHVIVLPPVNRAVITEASLLSVAAASNPESPILAALGLTPQQALGNRAVLRAVFKQLGFDEAALQVDLLTFENMTVSRPVYAAFTGLNVQLAALFSMLSKALGPLFEPSASQRSHRRLQQALSPAALAAELQRQLAAQLWAAVITSNASTALTEPATIQAVLQQTYTQMAAAVPPVAAVPPQQLVELCEVVATAISSTNTELQKIVAEAQEAEATGRPASLASLVSLASIAAVQQGVVAAAIELMSSALADSQPVNLTEQKAAFQAAYSGEALQALLREVDISEDMLVQALTAVTGGTQPLPSPSPSPAPAPSPSPSPAAPPAPVSYSWIAAPVVAGVCIVALGAGLLLVLKKRKDRALQYELNDGLVVAEEAEAAEAARRAGSGSNAAVEGSAGMSAAGTGSIAIPLAGTDYV